MGVRMEAAVNGLNHYFGKLCEKHPELNGRRRTANGSCTKCLSEQSADRKKKIVVILRANQKPEEISE
jgi:hypothetical protein